MDSALHIAGLFMPTVAALYIGPAVTWLLGDWLLGDWPHGTSPGPSGLSRPGASEA